MKRLAIKVFAALVLIQFIPYGRNHTNPPAGQEPRWDRPETQALARRACFDCHSNETRWPWYSHVAPASWLVQNDVDGARALLNFTEWQRPQRRAGDAPKVVAERDMPPWDYLLMHPRARLSDAERQVLSHGLAASLAGPDKQPAPPSGDPGKPR